MIVFRASSSGQCNKQIVHEALHPEEFIPEDTDYVCKEFLDIGHDYQARFVESLRKLGVEIVDEEQEVCSHILDFDKSKVDWIITGHYDFRFKVGDQEYIGEVKAVTADRFEKIKTKGWREIYPQYIPQAQIYGTLAEVPAVVMFFINRDRFEKLGGLPLNGIDSRKRYYYSFDFVEAVDPKKYQSIVSRYEELYEYIRHGEYPDECDKVGYCFHCKKWRSGFTDSYREIELDPDDDYYPIAVTHTEFSQDFATFDSRALIKLESLKADSLVFNVDKEPWRIRKVPVLEDGKFTTKIITEPYDDNS